jgi:hypothetical protein
MAIQSLRKNAAFAMLDRLSGKLSIGEIADELISIGYIEDSAEDYRNYQLKQARDAIGSYRRNKVKTDDIQNELINLTEVLDDGSSVPYFRKCSETSPEEAFRHIQYWDATIATDQAQRNRYFEFYLGKHGREFQRLFDFAEMAD